MCLYYPQQLLPGLAAVIQLRRHEGVASTAPLLVLVWSDPGVAESVLRKREEAFELLLAPFTWVRLVFMPPEHVRVNLSANLRVATKARYLQQRFGANAFAAIYYAHDIGSDFFAQSAMQAFPRATRVCFGDALGVVYSNAYYTDQTFPIAPLLRCLRRPVQTLRNILWRLKRRWTLPLPGDRLDAQYAALILPCDPGGDFLSGKRVLVVDQRTLRIVLDGLAGAVAHCVTATHSGVDVGVGARFVMLLGSFSESGLTTEPHECAMYVEAAQLHAPSGSVILLKAHPASYSGKVQRIADALAERYRVEFAGNDALPIEALRALVENHRVISFSYSSVSLLYLYGSAVIHAMTTEMIEKYFPADTQRWMHESNDLYLEQMEKARALRVALHGTAEAVLA